jgi:hypothetical protein
VITSSTDTRPEHPPAPGRQTDSAAFRADPQQGGGGAEMSRGTPVVSEGSARTAEETGTGRREGIALGERAGSGLMHRLLHDIIPIFILDS